MDPGGVPHGFIVDRQADGTCVVHHWRTGSVKLFLTLFLALWTFGCVLIQLKYMEDDEAPQDRIPVPTVIGFIPRSDLSITLVYRDRSDWTRLRDRRSGWL